MDPRHRPLIADENVISPPKAVVELKGGSTMEENQREKPRDSRAIAKHRKHLGSALDYLDDAAGVDEAWYRVHFFEWVDRRDAEDVIGMILHAEEVFGGGLSETGRRYREVVLEGVRKDFPGINLDRRIPLLASGGAPRPAPVLDPFDDEPPPAPARRRVTLEEVEARLARVQEEARRSLDEVLAQPVCIRRQGRGR